MFRCLVGISTGLLIIQARPIQILLNVGVIYGLAIPISVYNSSLLCYNNYGQNKLVIVLVL